MPWSNGQQTARQLGDIQRAISTLLTRQAELSQRLQQLERESLSRQLSIFLHELHAAAQCAAQQGSEAASALEAGLRASVASLARGKAGGLGRVRTAWRDCDGTFLPDSVKREASLAEYERFAAGGRARAARAQRAPDGTFLPT